MPCFQSICDEIDGLISTRNFTRIVLRLAKLYQIITWVRSLPLNETTASGAVAVIISGSDGWMDGQKRFLSQLINFTVGSDIPYVSKGKAGY